MSQIQTKLEAVSWLEKRLQQEGPGLWTDRAREEIAEKLAADYRPKGSQWHVKQWTQEPGNTSVQVITRGGSFGIYTVEDREKASEKAEAMVRTLNALDAEMRPAGDPA